MEHKLIFKKINGNIIKDISDYVRKWSKANPYGTITIGCDSQEHQKFIKYAVSIVMHIIDENGLGHGGHVVSATIIDTTKNMKSDIYTKLWAETELAVETAKQIGDIDKKISIHLDYNSKDDEYSHVLYNAGIGFAKGLGYEAEGKPFSWAASCVADKIAKKGRKNK